MMTDQVFRFGEYRKQKFTEIQNTQLKMSKKILSSLANVCPGYTEKQRLSIPQLMLALRKCILHSLCTVLLLLS